MRTNSKMLEKARKKNVMRKGGVHLTKKMKKGVKSTRGVVYFSHVPHGFYENELRQFLSQFGKVTNVNVPRSSRTGKYKGYAFVEFLYPEVAKVVAETMNNYLMFQKVLKAKYLPPEDQKPYCFNFPKSKVPLLVKRRRFLRQKSNSKLNDADCLKEANSLQKAMNKKLKKLELLGVNYEFQVANVATSQKPTVTSVNDLTAAPSPTAASIIELKKSPKKSAANSVNEKLRKSVAAPVSSTEREMLPANVSPPSVSKSLKRKSRASVSAVSSNLKPEMSHATAANSVDETPLKYEKLRKSVTAPVSSTEREMLPAKVSPPSVSKSLKRKSRASVSAVSSPLKPEMSHAIDVTLSSALKDSRKRKSVSLISSEKETEKKVSRKSLPGTDKGSEKKKSKKSLDTQATLVNTGKGTDGKEMRKSIDLRSSRMLDLVGNESRSVGSPAHVSKMEEKKNSTPSSKVQKKVKTPESKSPVKVVAEKKPNANVEKTIVKKSRKSISFPLAVEQVREKSGRRNSSTPAINPTVKKRKSVSFSTTPDSIKIIERVKKFTR